MNYIHTPSMTTAYHTSRLITASRPPPVFKIENCEVQVQTEQLELLVLLPSTMTHHGAHHGGHLHHHHTAHHRAQSHHRWVHNHHPNIAITWIIITHHTTEGHQLPQTICSHRWITETHNHMLRGMPSISVRWHRDIIHTVRTCTVYHVFLQLQLLWWLGTCLDF